MDYLGILLFILFIVVGGLRKQQQPARRTQPRPVEALPPVWQPWVEEELERPAAAVPELAEGESYMAPVPQYTAPPPQQQQLAAVRTQRSNRSQQSDQRQSCNADTYQPGVLDLNLRGLQRAVVMAEVLGPPKALKHRQKNRLF